MVAIVSGDEAAYIVMVSGTVGALASYGVASYSGMSYYHNSYDGGT